MYDPSDGIKLRKTHIDHTHAQKAYSQLKPEFLKQKFVGVITVVF